MPRPRIAQTPGIEVIIDSGAYSAWRSGKPIHIDEYCDYLLANQDWIWRAVCLDVIDPRDPENAAKKSRENYLHMRARGLNTIPVFHACEHIDHLTRMIDDGADYIGVASLPLKSRSEADGWYEMVWNHLVNRAGLPIVKVHAFGEGRERVLRKFPFYSADSASWVYSAQRNGIVQLETGNKMSCRKDGKSDKGRPDINTLDGASQEWLAAEMVRLGIDGQAFADGGNASYIVSTYCAALYFMGIEKRVSALAPISYKAHGFMQNAGCDAPTVDIPNLRFFLVSTNNPTCPAILAKTGHRHMLYSYEYIKSNKKGHAYLAMLTHHIQDLVRTEPRLKRYHDILNQYVK